MSNHKTIIDALYNDIKDLELYLNRQSEISYVSFARSNFRKSLLLAAASYFENEIKNIIEAFANENSKNNKSLTAFVRNKAIARHYSTFFSWDGKNANSFFGLFGSDFKEYMINLVKDNPEYGISIKAFLEIGNDRNRLVHTDYANFTLEKTTDELYELYLEAYKFLEMFRHQLMTNGK